MPQMPFKVCGVFLPKEPCFRQYLSFHSPVEASTLPGHRQNSSTSWSRSHCSGHLSLSWAAPRQLSQAISPLEPLFPPLQPGTATLPPLAQAICPCLAQSKGTAAPGNRGDQDSLVVFYPWQPSGFLWSFLPISNSSEGTGLETQIPRAHPRCCTSKGCLPRDVHKHKAAILMSNQEFKENAQPQHQQNLGQMIWFELLGAEPLSVKLSQ